MPTIENAPASLSGISDAEAADRRARGLGNNVHFAPSRSYGEIFKDNALTPINIILIATGTLLISLQLFRDALVTVGLVAINVGITIFQEFRAKRQLDHIALLTRPKATVIRNSQERTIDPAELVVGDLIVARPGDQIVVDGTMVDGTDAEMDESLLTGESTGVAKRIGDEISSGSFCRTGELIYEAEKVGAESLANSLTIRARQFHRVFTPVQRQIALVLRVMILVIFVIGGPVALDLILRVVSHILDPIYSEMANQLKSAYADYPVEENVRTAAVIISLIPQGLALMLTVTYAVGAVRIAKQNALLQQSNAIESLSHVDVLCMDKTGTLTTNRLAYHASHAIQGTREELDRALGMLAASVTAGNKTVEAISNALPGTKTTVFDEVPFSSRWKWSGANLEIDGQREWLVMGAPDVLGQIMEHDEAADRQIDEWSQTGLRVLLLARLDGSVEIERIDRVPQQPKGLEPLGLVAFADELQPSVRETIDHFEAANVALKIISGDHPETVAALARQAGVDIHPEHGLYSGIELASMNEREFVEAAQLGTVFGRITPEQKVSLISALQSEGKYVAMIGDGVNDVLALKRAQVGIAMESGSQATRAVSDMVLLGDSFAALPYAFEEGQRIVRGTQDLIKLFVTRVLSMIVVIIGVGTLGVGFPMIPTHNAIPAFLVVGLPTFGIAAWARPGPVPKHLYRDLFPFIIPASVSIGILTGTLFITYFRTTDDLNLARTVMTVAAVMCGLILIVFVVPPVEIVAGGDKVDGDWRPTIMAVAMFGLLVMFVHVGFWQRTLELSELSLPDWMVISGLVGIWAVALQLTWRLKLMPKLLGISQVTGQH